MPHKTPGDHVVEILCTAEPVEHRAAAGQPSQVPFKAGARRPGLTDREIRNLLTREKPYKVPDTGGLHLLVSPTGSRAWRLKYRFHGKEKLLALGVYPEVGLANARALRDQAKAKLRAGADPMLERKDAKIAARAAMENSFRSVASAWWAWWSPKRHQRYADDVLSRLERNVFPYLGHKPVSQIDAVDIVRLMETIQDRNATDIARRVRNTCSQIFRFALARRLVSGNPAAEIKSSDVLPQRDVKNHARIGEAEMPELLRKIEAYEGSPLTRLAIKLLALTFVRTSELIEAKWPEIDFDKAEWKIPAERMKKRRMHIVPLAPQAVEVLRTLQVVSGNSELLFPGERDRRKPMSNNTILKALERMGYKGRMTGHGFRGLASTHLYEKQFPSDHIELQLAHVHGKVRSAYDHSQQLAGRRLMMEYWAGYLDASRSSSAGQELRARAA